MSWTRLQTKLATIAIGAVVISAYHLCNGDWNNAPTARSTVAPAEPDIAAFLEKCGDALQTARALIGAYKNGATLMVDFGDLLVEGFGFQRKAHEAEAARAFKADALAAVTAHDDCVAAIKSAPDTAREPCAHADDALAKVVATKRLVFGKMTADGIPGEIFTQLQSSDAMFETTWRAVSARTISRALADLEHCPLVERAADAPARSGRTEP